MKSVQLKISFLAMAAMLAFAVYADAMGRKQDSGNTGTGTTDTYGVESSTGTGVTGTGNMGTGNTGTGETTPSDSGTGGTTR